MKALLTVTTAVMAVLATSSAAMAQEVGVDPVTTHLTAKWYEAVDGLQAYLGLDFMSRDGFYVLAGVLILLALFIGIKVMRLAQHHDEMRNQERILRARRAAQVKLDREDEARAAQAQARQRRYGG